MEQCLDLTYTGPDLDGKGEWHTLMPLSAVYTHVKSFFISRISKPKPCSPLWRRYVTTDKALGTKRAFLMCCVALGSQTEWEGGLGLRFGLGQHTVAHLVWFWITFYNTSEWRRWTLDTQPIICSGRKQRWIVFQLAPVQGSVINAELGHDDGQSLVCNLRKCDDCRYCRQMTASVVTCHVQFLTGSFIRVVITQWSIAINCFPLSLMSRLLLKCKWYCIKCVESANAVLWKLD